MTTKSTAKASAPVRAIAIPAKALRHPANVARDLERAKACDDADAKVPATDLQRAQNRLDAVLRDLDTTVNDLEAKLTPYIYEGDSIDAQMEKDVADAEDNQPVAIDLTAETPVVARMRQATNDAMHLRHRLEALYKIIGV